MLCCFIYSRGIIGKQRKVPVFGENRYFFGGLEGDRTLDLTDAKSDFELFLLISNNFYYFML